MKNDLYHILNRGVEKRKIFLNQDDYLRFIYNLYDFNNINNAAESFYLRRKRPFSDMRRPKKELVDILCWCLMPNHVHVMVSEKINGGAGLFSKKIIGGYTKYFNEINKRSGVLFQGRTKIIPIKRDKHFLYLPFYILSNPIKLIELAWKEKGIKNFKRVMEFLKNYRYSSFIDISGGKNYPFSMNKKEFYKTFGTNERKFKREFEEWLTPDNDNSGVRTSHVRKAGANKILLKKLK